MSKRSQRRKRRWNKNGNLPKPIGQKEKHSKKHEKNNTNQTPIEVNQAHALGVETKKNSGKKETIEVTESVRHFTEFTETIKKPELVNTLKEPTLPKFIPVIVPLTVNNTLVRKYYKVVKKPSHWASHECKFIGKIGMCSATDHKHGAKLEFETGEKVFIGFDALELAVDPKATHRRIPLPEHLIADISPTPPQPVTADTAKKGLHYKVAKKPSSWKVPCKFLDKVGKCISIDDRGIRLRFESGSDVSFQPDCLEEVACIDLNNPIPKNGINEDNVEFGDLFIVVSKPENLPDNGDQLVGKIGKAQWSNYHGVCLKFEDGGGYVIYFENLERYNPNRTIDNPVKVPTKLTANNIVFGRQYKFVCGRPGAHNDENLIGKMATIKWVSDLSGARIVFATGEELTVPFSCLQDLPRPTDIELIELIRKNPHRILRIVKGLEKITKLRPVQDFIHKGVLPRPEPAPARITETIGPKVPECLTNPYYHCDEESERENRVVALIGPIKSETENPS